MIRPNQPVDIKVSLNATNTAVHKIVAPNLTGDSIVRHEINSVIISLLNSINIIGRPYNKRGSSSDFKGLRAVYTIL